MGSWKPGCVVTCESAAGGDRPSDFSAVWQQKPQLCGAPEKERVHAECSHQVRQRCSLDLYLANNLGLLGVVMGEVETPAYSCLIGQPSDWNA